jgi:hypothetical protein
LEDEKQTNKTKEKTKMLHTTLNLCKEHDACKDGYRTLKRSLPKSHGKDQHISLLYILESNGLEDAIWALRATVEDGQNIAVEFAVCSAENVLRIYEQCNPGDSRIRDCLKAVRAYQAGNISIDDLATARDAAWDAAYAAYNGARAAWAAASAAWDVVSAAGAAGAATRDAAYAAYNGARAAWDASAAWDVVSDARAAGATDDAEREYQKQLFIKLLKGEK